MSRLIVSVLCALLSLTLVSAASWQHVMRSDRLKALQQDFQQSSVSTASWSDCGGPDSLITFKDATLVLDLETGTVTSGAVFDVSEDLDTFGVKTSLTVDGNAVPCNQIVKIFLSAKCEDYNICPSIRHDCPNCSCPPTKGRYTIPNGESDISYGRGATEWLPGAYVLTYAFTSDGRHIGCLQFTGTS